MTYAQLKSGYRNILETIYSHKHYYQRIKTFLKAYRMPHKGSFDFSLTQMRALIKSVWILGILQQGRRYFWNIVIYCLVRYPKKIDIAITMAVYGLHFRRIVQAV